MSDTPATPNPDVLSLLSNHFDALKPRSVAIEGIPAPLFFKPLTPEQAFKLVKAMREAHSGKQAHAYAELLVETVTFEDGTPAFPLEKGKPNPVTILAKQIAPKVFGDMVAALIEGVSESATAELEKK